ncbi:MAG TPA: nucleoside triphosphate pyrophosphatase [Verrucomicrobiae bacterium]|nr:nucleoside triphosphate pyrophosphatase [Verrucomicrobiae bacterium]
MKPPLSKDSPLVLASSSRYRAELLSRLGVPYTQDAPSIDESARDGEAPYPLALRLATGKAQSVAARHPGRWVLGSDQVPSLAGVVFGKPGTRANAVAQLRNFSGKAVEFHTAVALVASGVPITAVDLTIVRFRVLGDAEIERYVDAEVAYDCAGAFKAEGLGITLFEAIESRDPTALIGLPLILVRRLLAEAGAALP